jgi:hypothetical protein
LPFSRYILLLSMDLQKPDMNAIRDLYLLACADNNKISELVELLIQISQRETIFEAYLGASKIMNVRQLENDIDKFNAFLEGRDILENAIKKENADAEIRFLRFMVQSHIPKFIIYNNIQDDKLALLKNISEIMKIDNLNFKQTVLECLLESTYLTAFEKSIIQTYEKQL